jgi:tetratricopeptide (TPR) repeat protein
MLAGRLPEAIALHEATLKLREAALGHDHLDTLESRNSLGIAYQDAGRLPEAMALHETTLKAREAALGRDHLDTLQSRNNLATAYILAGRLTEAIALHEAMLKLREAALGHDHPVTLGGRNNLANDYLAAGRTAEAIELHQATLKLRESKLSPDHPDTLASRTNLATAYLAAGRTAEAIALLQATLELMESKLGLDHPDTLNSRAKLAMCFQSLARAERDAGRHRQALGLYRQAIAIQEDVARRSSSTSEHQEVLAWFLTDFGMCLREAGLRSEAEASLRRSLGIWLECIGAKTSVDDDPMNNLLWTLEELRKLAREERQFSGAIANHRAAIATAERLIEARPQVSRLVRLSAEFHEDLAGLVSESGRPSEAMSIRRQAVPLRERAQALCESERGRDHPETLSGRERLGEDYEAVGRWADAEALRRETLARRRRAEKPDGLLLAADLTALGQDLLNQSRWAEAESFLLEGLAIREKSASDDWSRYATMSLLGESLLGQRRYAEAEPLVVHGYEGMKARERRIPVSDRARLLEVADRVVRFYEAWDRPDQVTMWKAKLGMSDLPADVFGP